VELQEQIGKFKKRIGVPCVYVVLRRSVIGKLGIKSMQPSTDAYDAPQVLLYPGESRRILGEIETPLVKVQETLYASGLCIARHSHDTSNFIYVLEGAHWSGHGHGGEMCVPKTARFLPAGEPHENYFPTDCRALHIELRHPIIQLAADHGHTVFSPGELVGPRPVDLGAQLLREFRGGKDRVSFLGIESVVLQLLLAEMEDSRPHRSSIPPWLLRIREMLREQEQVGFSLAELSRSVGRHPVQISRQFHHHFGCTISEYIRRVRIARAQSLLARRDLEIADIALACGFSDQSHFTTAFRKLTGMPPHHYRLQISGKSAALDSSLPSPSKTSSRFPA